MRLPFKFLLPLSAIFSLATPFDPALAEKNTNSPPLVASKGTDYFDISLDKSILHPRQSQVHLASLKESNDPQRDYYLLTKDSQIKLFGDIIKLPKWLSIDLDYVSNSIVWNYESWYAQQVVAAIQIDPGKGTSGELSNWIFDVSAGSASGDSVAPFILGQATPPFILPQQIFGFGNIVRLYDITLSRKSDPSSVIPSIKFGKFNAYDDFASNYFYCSYMNLAFCGQINSPMFASKAPFAPVNNFGFVAKWHPKNNLDMKYGLFQLNTNSWTPDLNGLDFDIGSAYAQGTQSYAQIDYTFKKYNPKEIRSNALNKSLGLDADERVLVDNELPDSKIQLGAWYGSGQASSELYSSLDYLSCGSAYCQLSDSVQSLENASGVYLMANTEFDFFNVFHDGVAWANIGLVSNSRVETAGSNVNAGPNSFAIGYIGKGLLRQRPFDEFVMGFSRVSWAQRYVLDNRINTASQNVFELGYRFMIDKNLILQPGLQFIYQDSIDRQAVADKGVLIGGLQVEFKF